jgi:hypothetical protein
MRYDLELNVVDKLTQDRVDYVASLAYGNSNIANPIKWDTKKLESVWALNTGGTDWMKLKGSSPLPTTGFLSGIVSENAVKINSLIIRDNIIAPVFNGGGVYSYNSKFLWSAQYVTKQFSYDAVYGYYKCVLDSDYIPATIDIYTLKLNPLLASTERYRSYSYVPYDGISLASTFLSAGSLGYSDNSYTILNNIAYIDSVIKYSCIFKIRYPDGTTKNAFTMPEFPITNFRLEEFTGTTNYRLISGTLIISKTIGLEPGRDSLTSTFEIAPLITYKQSSRSAIEDIVFKDINISPSVLNFKSGALCASTRINSAAVPATLTIEADATVITSLSSASIKAKLTNPSNAVIAGAEIDFVLSGENAGAYWLNSTDGNNPNTVTIATGTNGEATATALLGSQKLGYFIQKEWITPFGGDTIVTLPVNLKPIPTTGNVYLYYVLDDDPILGKLVGAVNADKTISEYYISNSLADYSLTGRRIAFVKSATGVPGKPAASGWFYSTYQKPISVTGRTYGNMLIRDLYVTAPATSSPTIISNFPTATYVKDILPPTGYYLQETYSPRAVTGIAVSYVPTLHPTGGYASGMYPSDKIKLYNVPISPSGDIQSVIDFRYAGYPPSGSNVIGMWLVTDRAATIKVKAFCNSNEASLESNEITITIKSTLGAESEFIPVGYPMPATSLINPQLGPMGYFTINEYMKNRVGISCTSTYCIWTNAIDDKCEMGYGKYYPASGRDDLYYKDTSIVGRSDAVGCFNANCAVSIAATQSNIRIINPFL